MSNLDGTRLFDALSAPIGDLIASVGRSVADAQAAMDAQTIANLKELYASSDEVAVTLREIGYQPTWYTIPEVTAEISVALIISGQNTESESAGVPPARREPARIYAAPVDANYTNRYNYELKATSSVKFRIVPVPPSTAAGALKVVPDLRGKTFVDAKALLAQRNINFDYDATKGEPVDATKIGDHSPAAASVITGSLVMLTFDFTL